MVPILTLFTVFSIFVWNGTASAIQCSIGQLAFAEEVSPCWLSSNFILSLHSLSYACHALQSLHYCDKTGLYIRQSQL